MGCYAHIHLYLKKKNNMQINSQPLHPLKHRIYTWNFTYVNFQSNKFGKSALNDKWFSQKLQSVL